MSLPFVRQNNFELFYYTHHLYIIFIIFLAIHVGNLYFSMVAGSIFLFMIDRFLRFCQSRNTVDIISATSFPCGVVQLVLSTHQGQNHNALSSIFLQIKELSWLQWHPFSTVSNTCVDGKNHLSILIKASGNWTSQLKDHMDALNFKVPNKELRFTASIEGPYGCELSSHLKYEHLILVGGGIGISPLIGVLSDVIHRIKVGKTSCVARNVCLVWAIKTWDQLSLFSTIDTQSLVSHHLLHLQILVYVTQQSHPPFENVVVENPIIMYSIPSDASSIRRNCSSNAASRGNKSWFRAYLIISSSVGLIVLIIIANVITYEIINWWVQALLLLACMVASVLLSGGVAILLWHKETHHVLDVVDEEIIDDEESIQFSSHDHDKMDSFLKYFGSSTIIHYASRPNFKEIFGSISKDWGYVDVGVIVCGPQSLEESVAKECRSQNFTRQSHHPIFHFDTHSFTL